MYNEQIESLISAALADGVLTEKEKQILFKKAQTMGIDLDEFEMVLDARLVELQKAEKEKAEKPAPKSTKYGDVRKCPVCGALVPALAGVCPECGYEFSGVEASSVAQTLAEKLKETDGTYYQEKIIIESFPIPNTKNDLFSLIMFLQTKIETHPGADVYPAKLKECIKRADLLFPDDKLFARIRADRAQQSSDKKKKMVVIGCIGALVGVIVAYLTYKITGTSATAFLEKSGSVSGITSVLSDGASYLSTLGYITSLFCFLSPLYYYLFNKGKMQ